MRFDWLVYLNIIFFNNLISYIFFLFRKNLLRKSITLYLYIHIYFFSFRLCCLCIESFTGNIFHCFSYFYWLQMRCIWWQINTISILVRIFWVLHTKENADFYHSRLTFKYFKCDKGMELPKYFRNFTRLRI